MNEIKNGIYYEDGSAKHAGVVQINGEFYYAGHDGKIVSGREKAVHSDKTNGLVKHGYYTFDDKGIMDKNSFRKLEKNKNKRTNKKKKKKALKRLTIILSGVFVVFFIVVVIFFVTGNSFSRLSRNIQDDVSDSEIVQITKNKLEFIRNWDCPIYDDEPVHLLDSDIDVSNIVTTPSGIYAMYDNLMARYPRWISRTDLGLCSDGINHVFRYDFRAPEPITYPDQEWSEKKPTAILISGIHNEWTGIYGLFYALEEIMTNPEHYQFRANIHLIVVPCANPYCTIPENYNSSLGVLNANGVQIHRNFDVGFIYPGESGYQSSGTRDYGGTEPLSEIETQYINDILRENTDAAFLLSCHNFDANSYYYIWPSAATKYMVNMGFRLIDKMSNAWNNKYDFSVGLADYKPNEIPVWDNRLGRAGLSNTNGTETRQATKYGIQGINVEVCPTFTVNGTIVNPELPMSQFSMSRACETYVNFLRMSFAAYDPKDKSEYWK